MDGQEIAPAIRPRLVCSGYPDGANADAERHAALVIASVAGFERLTPAGGTRFRECDVVREGRPTASARHIAGG
jgi:hypothetical protein